MEHESIRAVCTLADRVMTPVERIAADSGALPSVTYDRIDEAMKNIIQVMSFLSARFFHDTMLGSVVPVPRFDVLEALDQPWVQTEHLTELHEYRHLLSQTMEGWADSAMDEFLPERPTTQGE